MRKFLQTIKISVSIFLKFVLLLLVSGILTPIGYFAWRAGRSMSMPEYGGRTYYGLLAEREAAYKLLCEKYQKSHPGVGVKKRIVLSGRRCCKPGEHFALSRPVRGF